MLKLYFGLLVYLQVITFAADSTPEVLNPMGTPLELKLIELEAKVASSAARKITFKEERSFPFRRKPIELEGVVRLSEGVGISLEYPEAGTIMIVDELGVLMRKKSAKGSIREKSTGIGDGETASLLKAALEFNRTELERLFFLTWFENEESWSIVMTPLSEHQKSIERVTLTGQDLVILRIELSFSGKKKITIFPLEELFLDGFSNEDKESFFRIPAVDRK